MVDVLVFEFKDSWFLVILSKYFNVKYWLVVPMMFLLFWYKAISLLLDFSLSTLAGFQVEFGYIVGLHAFHLGICGFLLYTCLHRQVSGCPPNTSWVGVEPRHQARLLHLKVEICNWRGYQDVLYILHESGAALRPLPPMREAFWLVVESGVRTPPLHTHFCIIQGILAAQWPLVALHRHQACVVSPVVA
jgi:hypothetical protein